MNKSVPKIYDSLQEIAWYFGNHGINGECCGDLSFVEFIALKKINEKKEFSVQEIGSVLNFTKSGATRIVNRLESKGYVLRQNSPIDGRICCVLITDKGTEAITKIINKYTLYLEDVLTEVGSQEVEHIREALEMLLKALQQKTVRY